jgi:hypothetical protein
MRLQRHSNFPGRSFASISPIGGNIISQATMSVANAYSLLGNYRTALPFHEELYEKHYQFFGIENHFLITKWLTECYFLLVHGRRLAIWKR